MYTLTSLTGAVLPGDFGYVIAAFLLVFAALLIFFVTVSIRVSRLERRVVESNRQKPVSAPTIPGDPR